MRMHRVRWLLLLWPVVSWTAACTGKDEALRGPVLIGQGGEEAGSSGEPIPRSGEGCADYQDALCDYVVRCRPAVMRAACDEQAQSIVCLTDGRAEGCAVGIEGASCGNAPGDCELPDVADREPAQAICRALADAYCQAQGGCALSQAECAAARSALACDTVFGVLADVGTCFAELANPACESLPVASCRRFFNSTN